MTTPSMATKTGIHVYDKTKSQIQPIPEHHRQTPVIDVEQSTSPRKEEL